MMRLKEAADFESNSQNFKIPFAKLSKLYGGEFLEYCRAAWAANDGILSTEQFAKLNGDVPEGFLKKAVIQYVESNPEKYPVEK